MNRQPLNPQPPVILNCYWRVSNLIDCQKFALCELTNVDCPVKFYCDEHPVTAVMEGIMEGFKSFITIPLYW